MKRVVSVSLGSSSRDSKSEVELLDERCSVERIGTDGDMSRAVELIGELDGSVDAIGLGGIDLYLVVGTRRWVIRDARKLAEAASTTPVVDGSGLKDTLERRTVQKLHDDGSLTSSRPPEHIRVLVVSGADRFGLAETFDSLGYSCTFGDLIYAVGLPIPLHSLRTLETAARLLCPLICRLPFRVLYPTGSQQEGSRGGGSPYFERADIIAGDFHFIRRNLPATGDLLAGKTIITNTTTAEDVQLLRRLGLARLITTTPRLGGRSFGTNVMEAALVAISEHSPEELGPSEYSEMLEAAHWEPEIQIFNS